MDRKVFTHIKQLLLFGLLLLTTISGFLAQERGAVRANSSSETIGKTRALIIGVSEYPNLDKEKQLNFAHKDALLFKDLLNSIPDFINEEDITLLINEQATDKYSIIPSFRRILEDSEEGDLVILFFAGHGDIQNVLGVERGYLLLNAVDPPDIKDYDATLETLPLSTIKEYVSIVTANKGVKVMLVFDACHSGKVASSEENSKIVLTALSEEMANTFNMVSCQPNELSYESAEYGGGHGAFTWFLVNGAKGLADQNKDGAVTLMELRNYLQANVLSATDDNQLPLINGNDREKLFYVENELLAAAQSELEKGRSKINATIDENDLAMNADRKGRGLASNAHPDLLKSVSAVMLTRKIESLLLEGRVLNEEEEQEEELELAPIRAANNLLNERAHQKNTHAISSSAFGNYVASAGEEGNVTLWSYKENKKITQFNHRWVKALAFSNDEKLLASGGSREVKLWDIQTQKNIHTFKGHRSSISSILFDPTGRFLIAAGEDGLMHVWDVSNKKLHLQLKQPNNRPFTAISNGLLPNQVFSSDNAGNIIIWDIETGEIISQKNTGSSINCMDFAWESNELVIGFKSGSAGIYDANSLEEKKKLDLAINNLRSVVTNSSGSFIAAGGKLWKYPIYDRRLDQEITSSISIPRGITSGQYNPYLKEVFLALNGGGWMSVTLEVPENKVRGSIYDLYNNEVLALQSKNEIKKLRRLIVNNITANAASFLDPYVSSDVVLPSWEETTKIRAELEWASKINTDQGYMSRKLNDYLLLSRALEAITSGEFDQLGTALDELLVLKKNNPDASYVNCLVAEIYQKTKKLKEAKKEANAAAGKIPDWIEPKLSIAYTLFLERNYQEADKIVAGVIEQAPSVSKSYVKRAKIKAVTGYYNEAKELFETALRLDPLNTAYLFEYSLFLLRNGELDEAKTIADKIRLIDENHFGSYFVEAEIAFFNYYTQLNNSTKQSQVIHKDAYEKYLKTLELGAKVPIVNYRLGEFYANMLDNKTLLKENYLEIPMAESINTERRRARAIAKMASDHYKAVLKGDPFMCSAKIGDLLMQLERSTSKKTKKRAKRISKSLDTSTPEECFCAAINEEATGKRKKQEKLIYKSISQDKENVFYYIKLLELKGINSPNKALDYIKNNHPEVNADYFGRKKVSDYSFFNYN